MEALIEVKKGEKIYQIIRSPWLEDKDGPVLFKLLSKQKENGEIEAVVVVERTGGIKTPIIRTTTAEDEFHKVVECLRAVVWKDFPDADLAVEDVEPIDPDNAKSTSQYTAVKMNRRGIFWLKLRKWFGL
ncbi:MAG: hypothetical protein V1928_03900 [Parcubacteria group bacterium]